VVGPTRMGHRRDRISIRGGLVCDPRGQKSQKQRFTDYKGIAIEISQKKGMERIG